MAPFTKLWPWATDTVPNWACILKLIDARASVVVDLKEMFLNFSTAV